MNKPFRGVAIVVGCVFLAGVGVAETQNVRSDVKSEEAHVSANVEASPKPPELDHKSKKGKASQRKEPTKDLLRARRPN